MLDISMLVMLCSSNMAHAHHHGHAYARPTYELDLQFLYRTLAVTAVGFCTAICLYAAGILQQIPAEYLHVEFTPAAMRWPTKW